MPICVPLVATPSTANVQTYASDAFVPAANDLLVALVAASGTGEAATTMTDSQALGFTRITNAFRSAGGSMMTIFIANALAANVSTTVTFDTGATDLATGAEILVYGISGMTKVGLAAVRQFAVQNNVGSGIPAPVFTGTTLTTNPCIGLVGNTVNPAGVTPPTGWTNPTTPDFDTGHATPPAGTHGCHIDSGFVGTTVTWGSSIAASFGDIIIELDSSGGGAATYDDSVSVSRKESVSDRMTNDISPLILLSQRDGVSDGMNNNIPKDSSFNKVLTISDAAGIGIYPALMLLQILSQTSVNYANMQGSVGLSGDLGIDGSPTNNINPNASLLSVMGVNLSGGLSLLSDLALAERLGFSVLGQTSIYPSLILGRDLVFVPANIALIGGSVSLGQALGLIDVPRLDAQASLAFLQRLGINLSSSLTTNEIEAVLALAETLGLSASAQLNSFPLVRLGERLFLLDTNNANLFGTNVLNEVRGFNIAGGLSIQDNVAIPIDLGILTNKLISNLVSVSIQERLGISDSVFANMQASVSLGETAGMGNAVSQMLNAELSINVVGSVLTISGLTVIIVKGFVFTSDATRNPVTAQDSSKTASSSDSGRGSVSTSVSDNYISTGDE